ncbi:DUF7000 family protein [Cyclobacterium marinum]|uniref:DUF7000 domain-containing protein n=1 Tax=Cyclobacterium marinum (strain ATCC 25205 / DSM 745 / LMG 13164 / NCIMB 1802) TaxID=880070 RepID=G0J2J1_CYCMS|nr:hypothetical protein [Cyclobacterium marinum]AEL25882.1 hypothetical protein Cycma_2137 [Cyclobacterium marinum DSM 745]
MESMDGSFSYYQKLIQAGDIARVYKSLIAYMLSLRTYFKINHQEFIVGSFYQGAMDFTYFSLSTKELKAKKLKLVIIFNHQEASFEIWLAGQNKQVQSHYSGLIADREMGAHYRASTHPHSILEWVVLKNPDFNEMDTVTTKMEQSVKVFLKDLSKNGDQ